MDGEGTGGEIGSIRVCVEISEGAENRKRGTFSISPFSGASYSRSTSPDHNPLTDREIN